MFRHVILNISNYIILLYVTSHFVDLLISLLTFINQYYRYSFVVDEIQSVNICHSGPWSQLVSQPSQRFRTTSPETARWSLPAARGQICDWTTD